MLAEVALHDIAELAFVGTAEQSEDAAKIGLIVLDAVFLLRDKVINAASDASFQLWILFQEEQEARMDMTKNSENSNTRMLLFVHHVVDKGDDDLGEHLQNLFGLEVVGVVRDYHRQRLLRELEVAIGIVGLAKVEGQPMSETFVCGRPINRFFQESFDANIVEQGLSLTDSAGSWKL